MIPICQQCALPLHRCTCKRHVYHTAYSKAELTLWPEHKPLPEGWAWVIDPRLRRQELEIVMLRKQVTKLNKACARHRRKLRGLRAGRRILLKQITA